MYDRFRGPHFDIEMSAMSAIADELAIFCETFHEPLHLTV